MAAHSERKTQTANFRAVQNFAKSNWQETAQLHTFAHSVTSTSLFLEFFFSAESVCADLANGRLTFEDDLRSGGLLCFISMNASVRTELANCMVTPGEPRGD